MSEGNTIKKEWSAEEVGSNVCGLNGHKLAILSVSDNGVMCEQCGLTLNEIRSGVREPKNVNTST